MGKPTPNRLLNIAKEGLCDVEILEKRFGIVETDLGAKLLVEELDFDEEGGDESFTFGLGGHDEDVRAGSGGKGVTGDDLEFVV